MSGYSWDHLACSWDPIRLYRDIAHVASVTYLEDRMLCLLTHYWRSLCDSDAVAANVLRIRRVGKGQVAVEWRGAPQSTRELVLVAHVDREGFLLTDLEGGMHDAEPRTLLRGTHVTGVTPEWQIGAKVAVCIGRMDDVHWYPGVVSRPHGRTGINDAESILIEIRGRRPHEMRRLTEQIQVGGVSAHLSFGGGQSEPRLPIARDGRIRAGCVDNFAGVSVCTSVLTRCVLERSRSNVSVLYTIAEEAGTFGVLDIIETEPQYLFTNHSARDLTFVVVDSSPFVESSAMTIQAWKARRFQIRNHGMNIIKQCSLHVATVRLEDRAAYLDTSVSRFLLQAGLDGVARARGVGIDASVVEGAEFRSRDSDYYKEWSNREMFGRTGIFYGDRCEVSTLAFGKTVYEQMHGEQLKWQCPRVGALVVPVENFRNRDDDLKQTAQEEATMAGALYSAMDCLLAAARLHGVYQFAPSSAAVYRGPVEPGWPQTEDELVGAWLQRYHSSKHRMIHAQSNVREDIGA